MTTITVEQAKADLTTLIERAQSGECIEFLKDGQVVARLTGVQERQQRRFGVVEGHITDAFFEPLPETELKAWEG